MVLVGDNSVGKSKLAMAFIYSSYDEQYNPTVVDTYDGTYPIKGEDVALEIQDTSGEPAMRDGRAILYRNADVFMLCVAVNNRDSLENIQQWKTEIRTQCNDALIILTGTQTDLTGAERTVSHEELVQQQRNMSLTGFCETSAKEWQSDDYNVKRAFDRALNIAYQNKYEL